MLRDWTELTLPVERTDTFTKDWVHLFDLLIIITTITVIACPGSCGGVNFFAVCPMRI